MLAGAQQARSCRAMAEAITPNLFLITSHNTSKGLAIIISSSISNGNTTDYLV